MENQRKKMDMYMKVNGNQIIAMELGKKKSILLSYLKKLRIKKSDKGNYYEGEFRNGKKHGLGVLRYADGSVYTGAFEENLR